MARLGGELSLALVERLVAKTGGSPMLLRLAVGQLCDSGADPAEFVNRLETQPQVAAYLLDTVLGSLGPATRRLAALLSVFRQPADLYDETLIELGQAADGPYDHAAAVDDLHRLHVVEDPARAQLHRLLRGQVYAALAPEPARRRGVLRLCL